MQGSKTTKTYHSHEKWIYFNIRVTDNNAFIVLAVELALIIETGFFGPVEMV